jgi:hypothetical protein
MEWNGMESNGMCGVRWNRNENGIEMTIESNDNQMKI